jgi:ribosomal protein L11 methyltransferase
LSSTREPTRVTAEIRGLAAAEAAADILGALASAIALFETAEDSDVWRLDAYPGGACLDGELRVRLALAAAAAGGALVALDEERVPARDWLAETRRAFPPLRIGRFLVHGSHLRPARDGAIRLEIDAASAFGTGEHPSTRGCLVALDRLARRRRFRRPRDIGCGSGILAIAAATLLRRRVAASDIDFGSVAVARHHVRRNGVAGLVRVECAAGCRGGRGRYDLVFANILARPLAQMARDLARALAPGGVAVLSGLLRRQEQIVLAPHRAQRLWLARRIVIDGWSTLILQAGYSGGSQR